MIDKLIESWKQAIAVNHMLYSQAETMEDYIAALEAEQADDEMLIFDNKSFEYVPANNFKNN